MVKSPEYKFIMNLPSDERIIERVFYCAKFNHFEDQTLAILTIGPTCFEVSYGNGTTVTKHIDHPIGADVRDIVKVEKVNDIAFNYLKETFLTGLGGCLDELCSGTILDKESGSILYTLETPRDPDNQISENDSVIEVVNPPMYRRIRYNMNPRDNWKVSEHHGDYQLIDPDPDKSPVNLKELFQRIADENHMGLAPQQQEESGEDQEIYSHTGNGSGSVSEVDKPDKVKTSSKVTVRRVRSRRYGQW